MRRMFMDAIACTVNDHAGIALAHPEFPQPFFHRTDSMTVIQPLAVGFSVLVLTAAQAQTSQTQEPQQQSSQQSSQQQSAQQQGGQQQGQVRTEQLIGKKVSDAQGQELGEIKDVVVDLQSGQVHAGVLEFGGKLGVGGKNYAFPIQDLKPGKSQGQYTLANVEKQKLEKAQGFAQGIWPEIDPQYWGREGGGPQASAGGTQTKQKGNLVRASKIKGKEVSDKSGQEVGELRDMTIDLQGGKLQNVVLSMKEGGGQAELQPQALSAGAGDKLVLNMEAQQVKQQAQQQSEQKQQQSAQKQQSGTTGSQQQDSGGAAAGASQQPKEQQPQQGTQK
jgi:sporulation protein YlmC with PRC-barrel domain